MSVFLSVFPSLLACQPETKEPGTENSSQGFAELSIRTQNINFPDLEVGEELSYQVSLKNKGDADLIIEDIFIEGDRNSYSIMDFSDSTLGPTEQTAFQVKFHPKHAYDNDGFVYIETNDPNKPLVAIFLNGYGLAPEISVSPSDYDFGTLYIGCEETLDIQLKNTGNLPLTINDLEWLSSSNEFTLDIEDHGNLPWFFNPSEARELQLSYAPFTEDQDSAFLLISSNDPIFPEALITQDGSGDISEENSQLFEPSENMTADIIFAFDRSCSMDETILNMLEHVYIFTETLKSQNTDFQVAATVGDAGCINPGGELFINNTHSTSQAKTILNEMIDIFAENVPYGSNEERAFMQFEATISNAVDMNGARLQNGCNTGLIREHASLHLIGISDEPEQSINNYSYYVNQFRDLKSNPDDVVFHAIGGDYPSGCGTVAAYTGMYEATVATGGQYLSLCSSNWLSTFTTLANAITPSGNLYALDDIPVEDSISVKINGLVTSQGWSYDAMDNRILFEYGSSPTQGDTIQVDYIVQPTCP